MLTVKVGIEYRVRSYDGAYRFTCTLPPDLNIRAMRRGVKGNMGINLKTLDFSPFFDIVSLFIRVIL
jgi:hypothetical protein